MVGLILDGKSITGSYQVGAYYALKKCRVRFKATLGRGIGSFNAAMLTVKKSKNAICITPEYMYICIESEYVR